jgi:hypothetical protein
VRLNAGTRKRPELSSVRQGKVRPKFRYICEAGVQVGEVRIWERSRPELWWAVRGKSPGRWFGQNTFM